MTKNKKNIKPLKIEENISFSLFPFKNAKWAYVILAIIGISFYYNTIDNEFALDDGIIIHQNEFVMKGAKGTKDILTHDAYYSFYRQMNAEDQLAGGRYRPLSVVSFAIEQSFIRTYPTGLFDAYKDINRNGVIDKNEYNKFVDRNNNNNMELDECVECWDINENGKMDAPEDKNLNGKLDEGEDINANGKLDLEGPEDINGDGLVNKTDCHVEGVALRHFNNMLFYVLSILVLFGFLKDYLFKNNWDLAFLTTLLFAIHPLHTEVVANMKSRDEIFSFLFIILTFIYTFKSLELKKTKYFIIAGFMYFLALLSKEYAFTLVIIIPLMIAIFRPEMIDLKHKKLWALFAVFLVTAAIMYVMKSKKIPFYILIGIFFSIGSIFALMSEYKNKTFLALISSLTIAFIIYMCFRLFSVTLKPAVPDTEVLNNPYLFANTEEKWATKIYVLLKYLQLLFYPNPLSSDYSFNTILYRKFSSWDTLLSLFTYLTLAGLTLWLFIKKHPISFGLIFFFGNLLMIGNILMDIGATMGERLIYHSSFGFAICIAWLLVEGLKKIKINPMLHKSLLITLSLLLIGVFGYKTIIRNAEWKNDITLFTKDVQTVPNSVLCLGNAGARWIDLSERPQYRDSVQVLVNRAMGYLKHALELHPKYVNGYLNLGLGQMKLGQFDSAYVTWNKAKTLYPNNPFLQSYFPYLAINFMNRGVNIGQQGKLDEAVSDLEKAAQCNPNNFDIWYNYGGVYFTKGDFEKAKIGFENALKLNPNAENAKNGLSAANAQLSVKTITTTSVTASK